jgi:GDPmannose 4,6-dehydratase
MWMMLQQDRAEDFVIGTGEMHSVREFVELAFSHAGLDWRRYVKTDPRYLRPAEVDALQADCSKARQVLGWTHRTSLPEFVKLMVDAECEALTERRSGVLKPVGEAQ